MPQGVAMESPPSNTATRLKRSSFVEAAALLHP
jgi:hypothetical protein